MTLWRATIARLDFRRTYKSLVQYYKEILLIFVRTFFGDAVFRP
jgi:hypothetical protein